MAYPDFLDEQAGADYDGIRGLLGVIPAEMPDALINLPAFGPQAELYVQLRVEEWAAIDDDPTGLYILRLATEYRVACLMAETWATGGTIGNVFPSGTRRPDDWTKIAAMLCSKAEEWIQRALDLVEVEDPTATTVYDLPLMAISGPTRAAFRAHGIARPIWWRFPPVTGVPPDWATSAAYYAPWIPHEPTIG